MTPPPDTEEEERRDDVAFERAGFAVAALAVTILAAVTAGWADKAAKARAATALEAIPDLLASWPTTADTGGGLEFLTGLAVLAPIGLAAFAFPTRWNGITGWERPLSPKVRWPLLAGLAVLAAVATTASALTARRDLGAATVSGVVWVHDGVVRGEVPWRHAQRVEIACSEGVLSYDVVFEDGVAPLGDGAREDIGGWISRTTVVDQTLRAYGVARVSTAEAACLRGFDEGLIPSERERFGAVVAG